MRDEKFLGGMKDQIRMSGQELIRRADLLELGGLDELSEMKILIKIPTYSEKIRFPVITFSIDVVSKTHADWLCAGNDPYTQGKGQV